MAEHIDAAQVFAQAWVEADTDDLFDFAHDPMEIARRAFRAGHEAASAETAQTLKGQEEDLDTYDHILSKQGDLLTRTVNALKGTPPELTTWSHHDIPELAQQAVLDLAEAREDLVSTRRSNKRLSDRYVEAERSRQEALDKLARIEAVIATLAQEEAVVLNGAFAVPGSDEYMGAALATDALNALLDEFPGASTDPEWQARYDDDFMMESLKEDEG